MSDTMIKLRDGDIYRWAYREPGDDRAYGRYHCCSQIAVVRSGLLRDTFWSSGNEGRTFGPDDMDRLELTFVANFSDLSKAPEYEADYYADADIVDLNHSNSSGGNFYLRGGAQRCASKMMETAKRKLDRALSDERMAEARAKELRAKIIKIAEGDTTLFI